MPRIPNVEDALCCAVTTAIEEPREVPAAPTGWLEQALTALKTGDAEQISVCVDTVLLAHSQYRAAFDVRGWLFDLRNANLVATGRSELVVD